MVKQPVPQCVIEHIETMLSPYGVKLSDLSTNARRYMTAKQASIYSGLSSKTIREKAFCGAFESIRLGNSEKSRVLIDVYSFDNWLSSFKHKPTQTQEAFNV